MKQKYVRINRYIKMNEININKINYIEKKCRINMEKYKKLIVNS